MNADKAKKIIFAKYPDAQWWIKYSSTMRQYVAVVYTGVADKLLGIGISTHFNMAEKAAWISAAEGIQKEAQK